MFSNKNIGEEKKRKNGRIKKKEEEKAVISQKLINSTIVKFAF